MSDRWADFWADGIAGIVAGAFDLLVFVVGYVVAHDTMHVDKTVAVGAAVVWALSKPRRGGV
jgi:hypothetical protein